MSPAAATLADVFDIDLDIAKAVNIFAYYVGALFFLAYFLSLFVSSLHVRQDSVVYPLTRPDLGQDFAEYIIMLKTSLLRDSSFDAKGRIVITLKGSFDESPPLHLKKGKGIECFLERGSVNIFVYHSPTNLGDIEGIDVKLINDAPYEIPYVQWRPSFITIMNPLTREEWGTAGVGRMVCPGVLTEAMTCSKNKRERNGICKALCLFHPFISLFNSPVRFGMFNNMVNAIFIFFLFSLLITSALIAELALKLKKVENLTYDVLYENDTARAFACAGLTWTFEVIIETLIRNVVPRVSACRYTLFRGLMEPIQSHHTLRDFSISLDWDAVRPLILNKNVTLVRGVVHLSSHCVFPVAHSFSITNLWGYLSPSEARETDIFMRTMNKCALPLPATLRWLSREASSLKDEILFAQMENDFKHPMCVFCCWLRDWPVNFNDEPWQNGLVLSHIISRDITLLMRLSNKGSRARRAQICMHQWYGLICCLFLQVLKQAIYIKSESVSIVNAFIQRTVTQFGKRGAREIQATWRSRLLKMKNSRKLKAWDQFLPASETNSSKVGKGINDNMNSALQSSIGHPYWLLPILKSPEDDFGFKEGTFQYLKDDLKFDDVPDVQDYMDEMKDIFEKNEMEDMFEKNETKDMFEKKEMEDMFEKKMEAGDLERPSTLVADPAKCNIITEEGPCCGASPNSCDNKTTKKQRTRRWFLKGQPQCTDFTEASVGTCLLRRTSNASADNKCAFLNKNCNALKRDAETEKKLKQEKDQQIIMLLRQKKAEKGDEDHLDVRLASPVSAFEEFSLGPPHDIDVERIPDPKLKGTYLRHKDEIAGYNCGDKQCQAFCDIHKMVGNSCMEILKRILQDLLFFALDSPIIQQRSKLWLRKRMVLKLFDEMDKKSALYEDGMFKDTGLAERENYACNQSLTTNLTILEVMIDIALKNQAACAEKDRLRREQLYAIDRNPQPRCLFCAKKIRSQISDPSDGCDDFEKLVNFFTNETIYVAEMEINAEMRHKATLQRFCAGIMNMAVREMLMELEDPPMVLSTKITRALLYNMLELKSPKASTDFREMSADELRRVGTRRERIQARHDASIGRAKKETMKQKKEKTINSYLVETLSTKWRVSAKENELHYCAHLLAQCLVQEKILGFSIYSGFISKEHELLLEGSRAHLIEVEKKATKAVLKIGNAMLEKRLDKALCERDFIDVVFNKTSVEAGFTLEAVSVMQVLIEPMFLKTCCFYINDIVERKIAEFIEFFSYMSEFDPLKQFASVKKLMKESRVKYQMDKSIVEQPVADHGSISTPMLRWGVDAIKGVAPVPNYLKSALIYEDPESLLSKAVEHGMRWQDLEPIISLMVKTRRKAKKAMEIRETEELKKLQLHLARVQARLTEQVALAAQSASDSAAVETDFQREYHRDELYNVELYATRDLQRPFSTAFGFFVLFTLVMMTVLLMLFTTFRTSNMRTQSTKMWLEACGKAAALYILVLQPVKCIVYSLFRFYRV